MQEEKFEALLSEHAPGYNVPIDAPLDEMWQQIELHYAAGFTPAPRARWRSWLPAVAGMAATMLLGFGLGRVSGSMVVKADVVAAAENDDAGLLREAASRYLGQTAALLIALPDMAGSGLETSVRQRAEELLTTTRVLIDSPASRDPELRQLMYDLEVVLAQVVRLSPDQTHDIELISAAMMENELLPRINSAVTLNTSN